MGAREGAKKKKKKFFFGLCSQSCAFVHPPTRKVVDSRNGQEITTSRTEANLEVFAGHEKSVCGSSPQY